ncbi:MAG: efflux RND transporter periplasmic adaptor subunit [Novosphingobium sp.]
MALALAGLSGCKSEAQNARKDSGPPTVGFIVMHPTVAALEVDLPGRIAAAATAEVRPQVSGIIQERLFTEGSLVRAGQPLYRIDPSLYRATLAQSQANLASAEANASAADAKAARLKPLAEAGAVAKQDYTDAAAAARQGRAAINQNRAAVNIAQINLRFATVPAPITGRIGRSTFTKGSLVTNAQTDPLAVISVLDPVYVDLQQSAADLIKMRQQMAQGGSAPTAADVWLLLDDGTRYPVPGRIAFSEVTADPATGTVTLRATFPNPQGLLLPGMFVHARLAQVSQAGVFLVPQVALSRDAKGNAQVYVVSAKGNAELRPVTAARTQGDAWVVTAGLADGDRVITQGLGKVKAGQPVKAVPESAPQTPQKAQSGSGKHG